VLEGPEVERTIDRALAGPLPETIARSIVANRVLERVVTEMLARAEAEDSRAIAELSDRLLDNPAFHNALRSVLSSPEVRAALTQQTAGFAGELGDAIRRRAVRADNAATTRRQRKAEPVPYGGFATRGIALVTDTVLINVVFLLGAALISLVGSLFGKLRPEWLVGTLAGAGWLLVVASYFVAFWSTTGQTPGMRLMRLRVRTGRGSGLGIGRSIVRLVGLALAIIPLFAGFIPVFFDRRRRALQDFLAGTVVFYDQASFTRVDHPEGMMTSRASGSTI
jgi:uncharacterized RDD family membrane protein YckC